MRLELIKRWFLFSNSLTFVPNKDYTAKIGVERMELPKAKGGYNLPSFKSFFSQAKSCFIVRLLRDNGVEALWGDTLFRSTTNLFSSLGENVVIHPFFTSFPLDIRRKVWFSMWIREASFYYSKIPKSFYYISKRNEIGSLSLNNNRMYRNDNLIHKNSIPVIPRCSRKYWRTTNHHSWTKVNIEFNKMEEGRSSLSLIRDSVPTKVILCPSQECWKENGLYKLEKLFLVQPNTSSKIKDFFNKSMRNYFNVKTGKCELCGGRFDSLHLFEDCKTVKEWELQIDPSGTIRKNRIDSMFLISSKSKKNLTHSWLLNWAIWLTRNHIVHSKITDPIDKLMEEAKLPLFLKHTIKNIEHEHIMLVKYMTNKLCSKAFSKNLIFFDIGRNNQIITRYFQRGCGLLSAI